jgi:hypothetical protein
LRSANANIMSDVSRAIEQLEEIHGHLARTEVYRGWRSLPVALSGVVGFAAAAYQSATAPPGAAIDPARFAIYWISVAGVAFAVGCAEMAWRYLARATATDRRRTRHVLGQFLPALVAAACITGALLRFGPAVAALLPGLWALLYGAGVFAARPYVPRASGWIAAYYWTAGLALLWIVRDASALSPWMVGGVFGTGQILSAAALYWNLERRT